MLDERFVRDPEFPNAWRPITRDESGRRRLGEPRPYTGFGGYAKATRLLEPAGAFFVEYHAAFAEPSGWFNGTNLLALEAADRRPGDRQGAAPASG